MKKIIKIVLIVLIVLSFLPVADMTHRVLAGSTDLKMRLSDSDNKEIYSKEVLNTSDCDAKERDSLQCEANYILGAEIDFTMVKSDKYSCKIKSQVDGEKRVFYVTPRDCEKLEYFYNDSEIEKSFTNTVLDAYYDKETGIGVSGCKNVADYKSINCQIAQHLYKGIKFSTVKKAEYDYDYIFTIDGVKKMVWLTDAPFGETITDAISFENSGYIPEDISKDTNKDKDVFVPEKDDERIPEKETPEELKPTDVGIRVSGCDGANDKSIGCQVVGDIGVGVEFTIKKTQEFQRTVITRLNGSDVEIYLRNDFSNNDFKVSFTYIYPDEDIENVLMEVDFINGEMHEIHPGEVYDSRWSLYFENGKIYNADDGYEINEFVYDGIIGDLPEIKEGFVVRGSETEEFLYNTLVEYGFVDDEISDFLFNSMPYLAGNEYNLISFQNGWLEDEVDMLVYPTPDTMFRFLMVYQPLDKKILLPEQEIVPFERDGFTIVEMACVELANMDY